MKAATYVSAGNLQLLDLELMLKWLKNIIQN